MKILSLANQKGGVAKTATAQNLGAALARNGRRVLLVDADPQGSLTGACGLAGSDPNLADVIGEADPGKMPLRKIIREISHNLFLAPSDISLSRSELGLISRMGRENVLKRALATVQELYDICLVDNPPSLGLLTVNSLNAADAALVPVQPQQADLRGLALFLETIDQIRRELNPSLDYRIIVTFYDSRINHHAAAIEAMDRGDLPLLDTKISRSIRVAEAMGKGIPVFEHEPDNPTAKQYLELADEVEKWLKIQA
jgi:chromosome partitioning protein